MSLVHQALRKAEREKERRAETPPPATAPVPPADPGTASSNRAPAPPAPRPAGLAPAGRSAPRLLPMLIAASVAVIALAVALIVNHTAGPREPAAASPAANQVAVPAAPIAPAASTIPPAVPPTMPAAPAELLPVAVAAGPEDTARFKLTGIAPDPDTGQRVALLNGQWKHEAEEVAGATVKRIERDRVTLVVGSREIVLRLN